jgi:NTE family protein
MVLVPSTDIRDVARDHAAEMPWTVRMLLKRLGMWGRDWRLASYLMFEPGYCAALIDMGYRDTMARAEEVARFVGGISTAHRGRVTSPAATDGAR